MWKVSVARWVTLAQWSAAAFIVAGVLRFSNLAISMLGMHTEMARQEWALDLTLVLAYGAVFIALLGVYPWLSNCAPRLSCAGVATIAIAAVGIIAFLITKYILIGAKSPLGTLQIISLLIFVLTPLSFLLFSVACLCTDVLSRTIGLFMLVTAAAGFVFLGGMLVQMEDLLMIGGGLFAVGLLAIGYLFQTRPPLANRA